jgi:hypothetical protein
MKMLATAFIRHTRTETTATINETKLFPQQDLVVNSIALIASDAFGYDGFDKLYTANYELDDGSLMAYFSRRLSSQAAKKLASSYGEFLVTFGGHVIENKLSIKDVHLVEILDTYEVIFPCGPYLAGVREAATIEQAEKLAIRLYDQLKKGEQ